MTDFTDPNALLTPVKAIRAKCVDCSGNQPKEVRLCPVYTCPLWPFRMGRRPTQKLYADKPPRYRTPDHLPVWDGQRVVAPDERQNSSASSGKTAVDGVPGGSS